MKYFLATIFLFYSIISYADASQKDCGEDGYECLPNCMQIYISNPIFPGSEADCKKNWDYFLSKKNWCMLTIMTFNGYGHKADPQLAKEYAQKADNDENATGNCISGNLVNTINERAKNPSLNKSIPLNICNLITSNDHGLCASYQIDDLINKANFDINNFATDRSKKEAEAAKTVWENYTDFMALDHEFRDNIGQFQGSGRATWGNVSMEIMIKFFIYAFDNFIHAYPEKFKTVTSVSDLDQQLNNTYKAIQELLKKIPDTYRYKKELNKQLIAAEKSWITYKNSYVILGTLYYGNKYSRAEIEKTLTAYLTRRRLAELKDQLQTIKGNLENWYINPS